MARELGMGVTPWSPLGGGALTGKYLRQDHANHKPGRGARVTARLDDKAYAIVEEAARIATQLETTVSRVALAWVRQRAGVASTIIGARTLAQLDDNVGSVDVTLSAEQVATLDALSTPVLPFPASMAAFEPALMNGGTTVNGRFAPAWSMTPANDDERY